MTAPSFKSFPPSFASFPEVTEEPSGSSRGPGTADASKRHRRHGAQGDNDSAEKRRTTGQHKHDGHKESTTRIHRQNRHKPRREKDNVREEDERVKAREDRQQKYGVLQDSNSRPEYYSDKRGDSTNLRYGQADPKQVPAYYLAGGGRTVFGLSGRWKVVYRGSRGVELSSDFWGRTKPPVLTDASARNILRTPAGLRILPSARNANVPQEDDEFIRIKSRSTAHQDVPYRDINRDESESDSHSDGTESSDEVEDSTHYTNVTAYQEIIMNLELELASHPGAIQSWLTLLTLMLTQVPLSTRNAVKARAEITLSVLSRAFAASSFNAQDAQLRLRYLQAGEEVWPPDKLSDEWTAASELGNADILFGWLEWLIRRGGGGVEGVLERITKVLSASSGDLDRLRIFWRTATFLRQAGYTERALAMFQAQAELNFYAPKSLASAPIQVRLDSLEEFWESEVPRVGEPGALGWTSWVESGKPHGNVSTSSTRSPSSSSTDPYNKWFELEIFSDHSLQPALRSTDAGAETDPYSIIMFADVRPFLFSITASRIRNLFRLVWLSFLGLHVPNLECTLLSQSIYSSLDDQWAAAHLCSPAYLNSIFPSTSGSRRITADSFAGALIGKEQDHRASFGPVKNWSYRTFSAFEGIDLDPENKWPMWSAHDVTGVNVSLLRNVFSGCRLGSDDVEWDNLSLAFEASIDVKTALKSSRKFLADARDSLPRWATHARLERMRGRTSEARKVYQNVLSAPVTTENRLGAGLLWWDWAEMEWLTNDAVVATEVIMRSAGVEGKGGVMILRAKRRLEDTAREIPAPLWKVREAWLRLGALLELLTGSDLPHFLTDPIGSSSAPADESLAVCSLTMLFHHVVTLRSATRPQVLRDRLDQAVKMYPNNTVIIGMFLEMQKGRGVWGRVRELLGELECQESVREKSVARRVADVWIAGWETGRWRWELERTRAGLEAGVMSERTRASPVLWRVFIEFEIRFGEPKKAKQLYFQAIERCAVVKELYMLAFGPLRPVFTTTELNGLAETMAERGVRMRRGLDEMLEGWSDSDGV